MTCKTVARVPAHGTYLAAVLPASLVTALGMALAFVPITMAGLSGARPEQAGLAAGLLNTAYQVGSALGLAITVSVAATRTGALLAGGAARPDAFVGGFAAAFAVAAGIAASGALLGLGAIRRPRTVLGEQGTNEGRTEDALAS